jgi:hypothetical protein
VTAPGREEVTEAEVLEIKTQQLRHKNKMQKKKLDADSLHLSAPTSF